MMSRFRWTFTDMMANSIGYSRICVLCFVQTRREEYERYIDFKQSLSFLMKKLISCYILIFFFLTVYWPTVRRGVGRGDPWVPGSLPPSSRASVGQRHLRIRTDAYIQDFNTRRTPILYRQEKFMIAMPKLSDLHNRQ